jgi:hypothetical protein
MGQSFGSAGRHGEELIGRRLLRDELPDQAATKEDKDTVSHTDKLGQVGRPDADAGAACGQLDQALDFHLQANIHADCRLIENINI